MYDKATLAYCIHMYGTPKLVIAQSNLMTERQAEPAVAKLQTKATRCSEVWALLQQTMHMTEQ